MAIAAVVLVAVMSPVLSQPTFGPVDDHELITLRDSIEARGWIETLMGQISEPNARFRPMYWVLRMIEVGLWDLEPVRWYAARLMLLIASIVLAGWAFRGFAPLWAAAIGALVVFAGVQSEAWYRLGPQETFAVPLTLAAIGLTVRDRFWLGIGAAVLAAATKEVFVVSSVLVVALAWARGARREVLVGSLLVTAIGVAVAVTWLSRDDLYLQGRSASDIAVTLLWLLPIGLWPLALVASRAAAIPMAAVLLASAVVYAGLREPRYLFPWAIWAGLATAIGLTAVGARWRAAGMAAGALAALLALMSLPVVYFQAQHWADRSVRWSRGMHAIAQAMMDRPGHALVVHPRGPEDHEAIYALRRYVPDGTAMVAMTPATGTDPLSQRLRVEMIALSKHGGAGYRPLDPTRPCIAAYFDSEPPEDGCDVYIALPHM